MGAVALQLILSLRGRDVALPMAYRQLIQGLIYRALAGHDAAALATRLHDEGYDGEGRAFKLFTFSPLSGPYVPEGRQICFRGSMRLEIRSPQAEFIRCLARSLPAGEAVRLGHNELAISSARLEDAHLSAGQVRASAVSPLIAYTTDAERHTAFLTPDDEAFYRAIVRNAQRKWTAFRGPNAPFELDVAPLPSQRWRREATSFKGTFLTAWYGRFELRGAPELIDFLYQTGLGAKNSEGFGMFDPLD